MVRARPPSKGTLTLREAVKVLGKHYGSPAPPPTTDPFELIVWENVAYLASPARRREAFERLQREVGTSPAKILTADQRNLEAVTGRGILKGQTAEKLRACAQIALERFGGDLPSAIRGPYAVANRALRSFPGVGGPGADKILLFAGRGAELAPESNGLRVLVRLGLVREEKSYSKTYAGSRQVAKDLARKTSALKEAHLLLQQHGQTMCTRSAPRCWECPLANGCAHARGEARRA
jgi:endonuclease III